MNWITRITTISVLLLLSGPVLAQSAPNWWDANWGYRMQLTFSNNGPASGNLSNFPVLVRLNTGNFDFSRALPGGQDIRFIDADNATVLDHEVERWDAAGAQAEFWVRVPAIPAASTTDHIWLYYGNAAASGNENPQAVWDSSFFMVQHLNDASPTTTADSTANGINGTKSGALEGPGAIAEGQSFDGVDDYIDCTNVGVMINNSLTASFWVRQNAYDNWTFFLGRTAGDCYSGWGFFSENSGVTRFYASTYEDNVAATSASPLGVWEHYTGVWDSAAQRVKIYRDGVLQNDVPMWNATYTESGAPLRIGSDGGTSYNTNGDMDEVRISTTMRTDGWIEASYRTQAQVSFPAYGAEESQIPGGSTTGGGSVPSSGGKSDSGGGGCAATAGSGSLTLFVLILIFGLIRIRR